MACIRPLLVKNKNQKIGGYQEVACGTCLMCRMLKATWNEILGNYEWNKFSTASYITLTYTNADLINLGRIVTLDDGTVRATNRYKDGVEFVDRIKKHIIYHKLESPALNPKMKYIMATEYGEETERNHIHLVIFGLDYKIGDKLIREKWNYGIEKILPLQSGGIRYVSEYLMKNWIDRKAEKILEKQGIEAPKCKHSKGLGSELFEKNLDYIRTHNGCIKWHGKNLPIPSYYARKFNIIRTPDFKETKKLMRELEIEIIDKNLGRYTKEQIDHFRKERVQILNKIKIEEIRRKGGIAFDENDIKPLKFSNHQYGKRNYYDEIPF